MEINTLVKLSHDNAVNKGFWDKPRETGTLLMLVTSELSEALEADRKSDKSNFEEEIADAFIRLADLCGGFNIDIETAIVNKMEKNKNRPQMHQKLY